MNSTDLLQQEMRIRKNIKKEFIDPSGNSSPIRDGLIDPKEYWASNPKILWVLKEPWCDGDERKGGGWSLAHAIKRNPDRWARQKTFQPICFINFGIWKQESDWDRMPWLRESEEMRLMIKKMAFINVSKLPGLKSSDSAQIAEAYQRHSAFIHMQINAYQPNLIFACDPHAKLLLAHYSRIESEWEKFNSAYSIQISPQTGLIKVYHPNQRHKGRRVYVNNAIEAATSVLKSP